MKKHSSHFLFPLLLIFSLGLFAFSAKKNKAKKITYKDGSYSVQCTMLNGMYEGKYSSYYPNKKKKAEGVFKENQRTGKWTVWDSTGKMRMQREYKNNFEYKRIFPGYPEGPAKLFSAPVYKLDYNAKGYIDYFYLNERAVAVSKRIWRYVAKEKNPQLFSFSSFYPALLDSVKTGGKIKAYDVKEDDFHYELPKESLQKFSDTAAYQLLGYKIKEDWFYDTDRMLSETRIIGLCPVVRSVKSGDTIDIAWFYFPYIRALMAKQTGLCNACPENACSLDNVFFFRNFHGDIYKESNTYDRSLKEYAQGFMIDQERLRIEMSLIELEHDEWLLFGAPVE